MERRQLLKMMCAGSGIAVAGFLVSAEEVGASTLSFPSLVLVSQMPVHGLLPFTFGAPSGWHNFPNMQYGSQFAPGQPRYYKGMLYRKNAGTTASSFEAYVLRCPHMGGAVNTSESGGQLMCPVHHSSFAPATGVGTGGPVMMNSSHTMPQLTVKITGSGSNATVAWSSDAPSVPSQFR
jgi:nitrite reductase/ring-hydroxylating ferredoxin subunit